MPPWPPPPPPRAVCGRGDHAVLGSHCCCSLVLVEAIVSNRPMILYVTHPTEVVRCTTWSTFPRTPWTVTAESALPDYYTTHLEPAPREPLDTRCFSVVSPTSRAAWLLGRYKQTEKKQLLILLQANAFWRFVCFAVLQ